MGKIITVTYLLLLHTLLCMCLLKTEGTAQNTNRVNATSHGINEEIRIVCYFTNWAQYRPGLGKFWPEDINPKLCTHLIYAFAKIAGGVLAPYEWDDETTPWKRGLYDRFNDIKNTSKSIKTLLAVGGWNFGSPDFHLMVSSQTSLDKFISHAVVFLRKWRFDGLDIDWEYPGARGSPAIDKGRFSVLLMNLHKAFQKEAAQTGRPKLLLSAAVAAGKSNIDVAYQPQQMIKYLDFINLMGYDLHGSWETVTGINSPLYKRPGETGLQATLNQDWAVKYWLSKGVPPSMINLGMGMYGRTFTLKNATNHSIGAPVNGPGQAGEYTRERGFFSYYEICKHLKEGWTPHYETDQVASYAWKAYQWVGYDNVESVTKKAQYVLKQKLGGAMVWDTALDDFNGTFCGQGKYPLMSKINEILRPVMDTKPTNESQTENISKKHSFSGRTLNQNVQFEEQRILTSRIASDAKDSKMLESNAIQEDFLQRKFIFKNTLNMKKDMIIKKPNSKAPRQNRLA